VSERVLVIAAHPDDEALGCGGTLAKHADMKDSVHVLFVADGETSRIGVASDSRRHDPANAACKLLGTERPLFLDLPDQRLDTLPFLDVVQKIEPVIESVRPTIIYTHHGGDLNLDHRIVHQAAMTALRPMPSSIYKAIYAFEVASSTEWTSSAMGGSFIPNHFVDITRFLETKMKVLKAYDAEMRAFPHSRSYDGVKALAVLRGANNGLSAAEGFMTVRSIGR